ncbi:MAG: hypothetical protein HGA65_13160, partial [Oscillochloris sp.]|nr:hypothetical protein [Oscillochloris sp.]
FTLHPSPFILHPSSFTLHPSSFAWLSLDTSDADPVTFVRSLVGALRLGGAAVGAATLALLQRTQPPTLAAALVPLLNDLAALPGATVLVLDDYHTITDPAMHEALAFAVERLPPHVHLILASRADPPLPLARLRARGHLVELHTAELRFTTGEAQAVLQELPELALSHDDLTRLAEHTEGWPAALQLACLALRDQPDPSALVATLGAHRYLFDYLADEVLDRQAPDRRNALLQTAILERLSGPLCEALLGLTPGAGAAFLEQLEREGLLLLPLDGERHWYRYHQLFAAFLRTRLRATATPEQLAELSRRAADVEPDPATAIGYLLTASLWEEAAGRIEACAAPLLAQGQYALVRRWIESMPPTLREARPGLCVLLGVITSRRGELALAESLLTHGVALSHTGDSDIWHAVAWSELALLALNHGELGRSAAQVETALAIPAPPAIRASGLMLAIFVQTIVGRRETVAGNAAELFAMLREQPNPQLRAHVLEGALSLAVALFDQLGPLEELCRIGLAAMGAEVSLARIGAEAGLAHIAWLRGRLDEALTMSAAARRTGERFGTTAMIEPQLVSITGMVAAVGGDLEGAGAAYAHAMQIAQAITLYDVTLPGRSYRLALVRWQQGRLDEVRAIRATLSGISNTTPLGPAVDGLLGALVAIADGAYDAAETMLRQVAAHEVEVGLLAVFGSAHPLLAHLEWLRGRPAAAATTLAPLLAACASHGTPGRLLLEGPYIAPLLQNAITHRIHPDVAATALAVLEAQRTAHRAQNMHAGHSALSLPPSVLPEPLSEREREVLRLLAAGRSNRAIAEALVVTVGTVKRHVSNLMGKLGADSRLAAVARGRDLGLV